MPLSGESPGHQTAGRCTPPLPNAMRISWCSMASFIETWAGMRICGLLCLQTTSQARLIDRCHQTCPTESSHPHEPAPEPTRCSFAFRPGEAKYQYPCPDICCAETE